MGYNLSIRCLDHKVEMTILNPYEIQGIHKFAEEHPRCSKAMQIDNGFGPGEEWCGGEGFEEKTFPDDWGDDPR